LVDRDSVSNIIGELELGELELGELELGELEPPVKIFVMDSIGLKFEIYSVIVF